MVSLVSFCLSTSFDVTLFFAKSLFKLNDQTPEYIGIPISKQTVELTNDLLSVFGTQVLDFVYLRCLRTKMNRHF